MVPSLTDGNRDIYFLTTTMINRTITKEDGEVLVQVSLYRDEDGRMGISYGDNGKLDSEDKRTVVVLLADFLSERYMVTPIELAYLVDVQQRSRRFIYGSESYFNNDKNK